MPKSGIKIIEETPGDGPELKKGDKVRLRYDIQLNRGDFLESPPVRPTGARELWYHGNQS